MFEKDILQLRKMLSEENSLLIEAIDDLRKEIHEAIEILKKQNQDWNG